MIASSHSYPVAYPSAASAQPAAPEVALLTLRHRANWQGDKIKLPHYLIPGLGARIDEAVGQLVASLTRKFGAEVQLAWAAESTNIPGTSRPLRVIRTVAPGHQAVCDVNLYATGGDLCVRIDSLPRTRIVYLRRVIYLSAFLLLFALGYCFFLNGTSQYESLARDYAHKLAVDGNDVIVFDRITGNLGAPRWSYLDFFRSDPSNFLLTIGKVPFLLTALIAGLLILIPADWFRFACDWMGYPRPDKFRAAVNTHNTAVANTMDQMLLDFYGIDRSGTRPIA